MLPIYLIIFTISLFVICLELFFTTILALKTWNHVVYLIIPFAILGYGIGANLYLIFKNFFDKVPKKTIITFSLLAIVCCSVCAAFLLAGLDIQLMKIVDLRQDWSSLLTLIAAYTIIFVPFIPFGFLIVYFFSQYPQKSSKLYFYDLLGAGLGAAMFVFLINHTAVVPSIILLALTTFFLLLHYRFPARHKMTIALMLLLYPAVLFMIKEPRNLYAIDNAKGWENFSKVLKPHQHDWLVSQWTPLGRTDIHAFKDRRYIQRAVNNAFFRVNLNPSPDYSYITTNITAGTPIFSYSREGLAKHGSKVDLFSQPFEVVYTLQQRPHVVVIGVGGGKDLFIAKTHGAASVTGAEINPGTFQQMSAGGRMHEYSGGIYTAPGVTVHNVDGRHLVKTIPENSKDLIVLTGTDTFSGLLNGAYTYAESYLYTREAIVDYLRILNQDGVLNFNRRFFPEKPREGLRLFTTSLAALKMSGAAEPEKHIAVGAFQKWTVLMVKKTPFSARDKKTIAQYFTERKVSCLFLGGDKQAGTAGSNPFQEYAQAFRTGREADFLEDYPYDVSVVSDNKPFFYKYYKFNLLNPFKLEYDRHTGTMIFITQIAVLAQAFFFILLFIFIPLIKFKISGIHRMPRKTLVSFVSYFSCLGVGFMMIEIPLMQKFVLLLGSPIYSISVTLTALLICSGIGSLLSQKIRERLSLKHITAILFLLLFAFMLLDKIWMDQCAVLPFALRTMLVCLMILPIGLCLGVYFPSGLELFGCRYPHTIAWAWGLNSAFSVLGSILPIILAQYLGFNFILVIAFCLYSAATVAYSRAQ